MSDLGGSHDYWGGPGYNACVARIGPDFEDIFYKNNWAANAKMISYYMTYGCVTDKLRQETGGFITPSQWYKLGRLGVPRGIYKVQYLIILLVTYLPTF